MSNDLINRKALMEEIDSLHMSITGLRAGKGVLLKFMEEYKKSVLKCIDEAPTAYDVDAMYKEMNRIGKIYCNSVKCECECENCDHFVMMNTLTNIVRNGGKK